MLRLGLVMGFACACTSPQEQRNISYDDRHTETQLDVYMPDDGAAAHPTVMFIHGGTWRHGDKSVFEVAGRRLAASGFTVASINYRLLPAGVYPNNIEDCLCALAFLRANAASYAIDPDRIGVMGYSAGAHLAGVVGFGAGRPELAPDCAAAQGQPIAQPAAVIPASGPMDMREFYATQDHAMVAGIFGGTPDELPIAYDLGSPSFYVRPGQPPSLLMYDAVEFGGVRAMGDALAADGNDVRVLQVSGSLHIFEQHDDPGVYDIGVASETPEAWIAIEDFLFRTIAGDR